LGKPSAPAAPDPVATANAQTASNKETAIANAALNRVNQYTPYGSSTYSTNGTDANGIPEYTQNVTLSPEQQSLYNKYTQGQNSLGDIALGMQGQVANAYANPINTSGAPGLQYSAQGYGSPTSAINNSGPGLAGSFGNSGPNMQGAIDNGDYAAQIKNAQDAAYRGQTQYLDPQFEQGQKAMDNSLINQGITQGSEAGNNARNNYALQKQRAYQGASDAATLAGQNEQNTLFNQAAQRGNFVNAANQQGYNQALGQASFQNAANAQGFGQGVSAADLQNQANQQGYSQSLGNANLNNQGNAQYLQQLFALRNQPLNEYNALTSGAQVTNPNFMSVPGAAQANTDIQGITNDAYQNQLKAYNSKMSGINNLFGVAGSLGGAAIGKWG
jgi:hypothetical protein